MIILFFALALLPAAILLFYVYKKDRFEKEPPKLLVQLILLGIVAGFSSMALETIGTIFLNVTPLDPAGKIYTAAKAFFVVAVTEEGTKYLFMSIRTWDDPEFNFRFDGIVYSVFTSLGFAGMENVLYALGFGPRVLLPRAILSIPGHMSFAVLFGLFYGRARICSRRNRKSKTFLNLVAGYFLAVLLHGLYDTCAMIGSTLAILIFLFIIVVVYLICFMLVHQESATDTIIR
jgi:RsiW-degrading membrane proteinase PrsW (M82 family)